VKTIESPEQLDIDEVTFPSQTFNAF